MNRNKIKVPISQFFMHLNNSVPSYQLIKKNLHHGISIALYPLSLSLINFIIFLIIPYKMCFPNPFPNTNPDIFPSHLTNLTVNYKPFVLKSFAAWLKRNFIMTPKTHDHIFKKPSLLTRNISQDIFLEIFCT